MNRVMVTYKVKTDKVAENESLVQAVYEELRQINNPDMHYATFKLEDGQTFVHIASFDSQEGREALSTCNAFKEFQKDIKERCEVPPNPQPLSQVGSFNFA